MVRSHEWGLGTWAWTTKHPLAIPLECKLCQNDSWLTSWGPTRPARPVGPVNKLGASAVSSSVLGDALWAAMCWSPRQLLCGCSPVLRWSPEWYGQVMQDTVTEERSPHRNWKFFSVSQTLRLFRFEKKPILVTFGGYWHLQDGHRSAHGWGQCWHLRRHPTAVTNQNRAGPCSFFFVASSSWSTSWHVQLNHNTAACLFENKARYPNIPVDDRLPINIYQYWYEYTQILHVTEHFSCSGSVFLFSWSTPISWFF